MYRFWQHLSQFCRTLGEETVYQILVMFYCLFEEKVPPQIKTTIIGALGYFIAPLDFIPDLAPFMGLTDDITALGSAYMLAQIYATPEVREKAERKRDEIFRRNNKQLKEEN